MFDVMTQRQYKPITIEEYEDRNVFVISKTQSYKLTDQEVIAALTESWKPFKGGEVEILPRDCLKVTVFK